MRWASKLRQAGLSLIQRTRKPQDADDAPPSRNAGRRAASMVVVKTDSGVFAMNALAVLLLLSTATAAAAAENDSAVRTHSFLLERGVALDGYDPVSYFRGAPAKEAASRVLTHLGVVYRFSSDENREAFAADPADAQWAKVAQ